MAAHGKSRGHLVQYLGKNRATFQCAKGHRFDGAVIRKLPPGRKWQDFETGIRILVNFWSKDMGGCTLTCPECKQPECKQPE